MARGAVSGRATEILRGAKRGGAVMPALVVEGACVGAWARGCGCGGGWVDERGYGQLSKRGGLGDGRWVAVGVQLRTLKGPFSMPTGFTGVGKGVCQVRAERSCRCFCSAAAAASPSAVSSPTRTDETVYLPPPPPAYLTVFF